MEYFTDMFAKRTACMLYQAIPGPGSENSASWVGGNAPAYFDDQDIHEGDQTYYFYLSLLNPFKPGSMISIFIPAEYEDYLDNNMYPHCSIKVFEHPASAESAKDRFTHPGLVRHAISDGVLNDDKTARDQSFFIKLGGNPRLIQEEDYYFKDWNEESLSFFFQVDEDGYPDTLLQEDWSYPFGFGALYIFANFGTEKIQTPVAGFWQFS